MFRCFALFAVPVVFESFQFGVHVALHGSCAWWLADVGHTLWHSSTYSHISHMQTRTFAHTCIYMHVHAYARTMTRRWWLWRMEHARWHGSHTMAFKYVLAQYLHIQAYTCIYAGMQYWCFSISETGCRQCSVTPCSQQGLLHSSYTSLHYG